MTSSSTSPPQCNSALTATPKRDASVDTYACFADPVYTYALKDGIGDGFLTPFEVRQIASSLDTPTPSATTTKW